MNNYIYQEKQATTAVDYKNAEYTIDGNQIILGGESRYFGNELITDLNNDGRDDMVFLITHQPGGSGTFFYVVAALNTDAGYIGSEGYLLGDRVSPQTTEVSQNPQHQNVVVVNYADRAPEEPMTAQPSIGKSAYLKLDTESMQWGVVLPNFEGEADPQRMSLGMKKWMWQHALFNDERELTPIKPGAFAISFSKDGSFSVSTDCNSAGGTYTTSGNLLTFVNMYSTEMYCEGSQETEFFQLLENTSAYHFTNRGELILDLKNNSGTVTFK